MAIKRIKMKEKEIKKMVRKGYDDIVKKKNSCCGPVRPCCEGANTPKDISKNIGYTEEELYSVPEGGVVHCVGLLDPDLSVDYISLPQYIGHDLCWVRRPGGLPGLLSTFKRPLFLIEGLLSELGDDVELPVVPDVLHPRWGHKYNWCRSRDGGHKACVDFPVNGEEDVAITIRIRVGGVENVSWGCGD